MIYLQNLTWSKFRADILTSANFIALLNGNLLESPCFWTIFKLLDTQV
jgi:hypothetical protein